MTAKHGLPAAVVGSLDIKWKSGGTGNSAVTIVVVISASSPCPYLLSLQRHAALALAHGGLAGGCSRSRSAAMAM